MVEKKIKVAHIITSLELGGAQGNTLYTVNNLDKNKFDTFLIAGRGGVLDNETGTAKVYFVEKLVRQISIISDILVFYEMYIILAREKPDVVHTHSSKAGILGRWAAKKAKIPAVIHTFHGFGFNDFQNKLKKYVFVIAEKITARITDKFIFVSNENIKTAQKYKIGNKKDYLLIRSGIKILDYTSRLVSLDFKRTLEIKDGEVVITTIGPFKPQKNLLDFVEMANVVAGRIKNTEKTVRFIIVGDGQQRKAIEDKVREKGLENKVLFLGWRKDIPDILSITNIFVMTALWEGLPRSVVEALVSGIPVTAYAVDGTKEIVRDNETGFLVQPRDYRTLAEKVLMLLNRNEIMEKFSKAAKESIDSSFDIDYMVRKQENLYKELIES